MQKAYGAQRGEKIKKFPVGAYFNGRIMVSKTIDSCSNQDAPATIMIILKIIKEKIILFIFRIFSRLETYFGLGPGYLTGNLIAGEEAGGVGRLPSIIFRMGNWQLHLHHWLISLAVLIFIFAYISKRYKIPGVLLFLGSGFLTGLIFQGIFSYPDWYRILHRTA